MTWLVPEPQRELTPHRYKADSKNVRPVELAVVHWTASPMKKGVRHGDDPGRMRRWLAGEGRESSTHLVVTRAGEILQGAPLTDRTWHSGGSVWRGAGDVNQRSIAIDLENVGNLSRGTGRWVDAYGGSYSGPEAVREPYKRVEHWEPYRVAQLVSFFRVAQQLVAEIPVLRDPDRWTGHADIRPTKLDPGPHFPWATLFCVLDGSAEPGAIDDWDGNDRGLAVDA